jgi:hypothetical protein
VPLGVVLFVVVVELICSFPLQASGFLACE